MVKLLARPALALDSPLLNRMESLFHRSGMHLKFHELSGRYGLPVAHLAALLAIRDCHIVLISIGDCYVCLAVGPCNVCFISLSFYWIERYFLARVID